MLVRTRSIVLRRMRYGDTSIIATLLTADRGIESIIAKGARSAKSRTAAMLQPFEELDVQYYAKPGRELHILRSAERTALRRRLMTQYEHTVVAYSIVEMVLRVELPGHPSPEVYGLVSATLAALDAVEVNVELFPIAFGLRLAALHGYPLQLEEWCADNFVDQLFTFRLDTGTAYPDKGAVSDWLYRVPGRVIEVLYQLQTKPLEELSTFSISPDDLLPCQSLVQKYLEYHFERPIRPLQSLHS